MNRYKLSKAGIDVNEGIRRLNNDKEIYEDLLLRFMKDANYTRMCQVIEEGDAEKAFAFAHGLKGVAGNLSLVRLHADLIPLVEELRKGSLERADELLAPVTESYEAVVRVLESEQSKQR